MRGLSPESLKIVTAAPIAPSGTRRRPAKKPGAVADFTFDRDEYVQSILISNKCNGHMINLSLVQALLDTAFSTQNQI
jgi:hypothetical protein